MSLVSYVRCFHCNAEQSVIGPTVAPTFQYPGWVIDMNAFYTPSAAHFCPLHIRRVGLVYCEQIAECPTCESGSGVYVDVPVGMPNGTVLMELHQRGITCDSGNTLVAVDAVEGEYFHQVQRYVTHWLSDTTTHERPSI